MTSDDPSQIEISEILASCARQGTRATLVPCDRGGSYPLRFANYSPERDEIVFDLPATRGFLRLEPLSVCWVSFVCAGRPTAFLSQILRTEDGHSDRSAQIALRPPTRLAQENLRSASRVSGLRDTDLRVRIVVIDRQPTPAVPLDMSLSGMLLELSPDDPFRLALHEVVELELTLGNQSAWMLGVVRRRSGRKIGIHFPETLRDGRIDPPHELARIVRCLEHPRARI